MALPPLSDEAATGIARNLTVVGMEMGNGTCVLLTTACTENVLMLAEPTVASWWLTFDAADDDDDAVSARFNGT